MKKNTSNFGKLQLNKTTIIKLNNDQMEALKGGRVDDQHCHAKTATVVCNVKTATNLKAAENES